MLTWGQASTAAYWNLSFRVLASHHPRRQWIWNGAYHRLWAYIHFAKAVHWHLAHLRSATYWKTLRGHRSSAGVGWESWDLRCRLSLNTRHLLLVVVEHVCQDVLGVLEPLRHLCIVAVKCLVQWHSRSFSLLVDICDVSVLWVKKDFGVILEVYLNNFVAKSEHDSVLCTHPLLHVNWSCWVLKLVCCVLFISLNQLLFLYGVIVLL